MNSKFCGLWWSTTYHASFWYLGWMVGLNRPNHFFAVLYLGPISLAVGTEE